MIREIIKYLCIVMILIVGLYVAIDFFEKIDNFMGQDLPLALVISFLVLKTPLIIAQTFPISLFLSVIIVFGLMNKHNEVLALKSSGISVYTLLKPVLGVGLVFSVLLFFFSEILVPLTVTHANRIWQEDVKKKPAMVSREKNIWIQGERSISHIRYYNPASMSIHGVALNYFDDAFSLIRRVDAEKGDFIDGRWVLENVMEQLLDKDTGNYTTVFYEKKESVFGFVPEDLGVVIKKSQEMNFSELLEYIKKIESDGYDASTYKVDLYAKLAFPFVCIILCLAGVGIALRISRKEGPGIGIAVGIGTAFLYWIFYGFCLSLGYGEMLPPVIAAWTANLLFFCFAVIMLLNAD
ncbi:MAG: LPS export ABC transporter permease LptG [Desulfobacterales bacterium]